MIKYLQSKSAKIAVSATIAILISNYLDLKFGVTSGIIAILTIQDTKKEALRISGRRILAACIAILISFILYVVLGNNPIVFGLFLVIFIPITKILKMQESMVVGAVLSTHLLTSSNIDSSWIMNEFLLTIVGITVGMAFNLYGESLEEIFEHNKEKIEENYRTMLSDMSLSLVTAAVPIYENEMLKGTENLIRDTELIAYKISNNYLFKSNYYHVAYIDMRIMQMECIKRMNRHFSRFYMTYEQTKLLSQFTYEVAINIYADNDCLELIHKINELKENYKKMDLPKNRDEFENRALLFQFLNDLEDFLIIKKEFKDAF